MVCSDGMTEFSLIFGDRKMQYMAGRKTIFLLVYLAWAWIGHAQYFTRLLDYLYFNFEQFTKDNFYLTLNGTRSTPGISR